MHTQDEDHGCRGAGLGIGAIGKDFTRRNKGAESIMSPYDQDNLSVSFGSMSIRTYHTYSSNEPNYTHYPCVYGFESNDDHSKSFGLFDFSSSRFLHEVCDL